MGEITTLCPETNKSFCKQQMEIILHPGIKALLQIDLNESLCLHGKILIIIKQKCNNRIEI